MNYNPYLLGVTCNYIQLEFSFTIFGSGAQEVNLIPFFFTLGNCITKVKKLPLIILKEEDIFLMKI